MKNRTAILILILLSTAYPVQAQESPELGLLYVAFFPYDIKKTPHLFEEPSYQNIGRFDTNVFEFNESAKKEIVFRLRELMKNHTGDYPPLSEEWINRTPVVFRLADSYFGNPKGQSYKFSLYPDFLVMEYNNGSLVDNKTHSNIFSYFLSKARNINKLSDELEIATSSDYKVIIFCYNCYTDVRGVNIKMYKDFFRMNKSVKKSGSDTGSFILYDTPVMASKIHDAIVVDFHPEDELFAMFELKEIIVPYSNERIRYLIEEDIDNSTQELEEISEDLGRSESTKDTKPIIEDLRKIGEKGPDYYEELSKFRVLKNKEANFLNDKPNYFQIISGETNKTYEREIEEHISSLEGSIILLDSKIDFWDSLYWHLTDNSMAKLSYQQQKEHFRNSIIIFVIIVGIIDILIRTYEQEIKGWVRPRLNPVISAISNLIGKIKRRD